ncbi:MAG: hypothetical protein JWN04_6482 [Myxococcaceae bacterium]|nr:hypothetical protein [Myxococcaceae bacterium]
MTSLHRLSSLLAAVCLYLCVCQGEVRAQACPANELSSLATLPLAPKLSALLGSNGRSWRELSSAIDQLRQMAHEEYATTRLPAFQQLADVLLQILGSYDGTPGTARELRQADLKPEACPGADVPQCGWEVLSGSVQVPTAPDATWTCDKTTLFANYIACAQALVARMSDPLTAKADVDLKHFTAQWQRYVEDGYSQYPWEVWTNGLVFLDKTQWGPPENQLIALHPAVGFGTQNITQVGPGTRTAAFVLAVEAVGYVRYMGDFRHHLGVSLAGVLPNLEWHDAGLGPIVHFDGFGVGYNVGLKGDRPATLFMLLDVTRNIDDSLLLRKAAGAVRSWLP